MLPCTIDHTGIAFRHIYKYPLSAFMLQLDSKPKLFPTNFVPSTTQVFTLYFGQLSQPIINLYVDCWHEHIHSESNDKLLNVQMFRKSSHKDARPRSGYTTHKHPYVDVVFWVHICHLVLCTGGGGVMCSVFNLTPNVLHGLCWACNCMVYH